MRYLLYKDSGWEPTLAQVDPVWCCLKTALQLHPSPCASAGIRAIEAPSGPRGSKNRIILLNLLSRHHLHEGEGGRAEVGKYWGTSGLM